MAVKSIPLASGLYAPLNEVHFFGHSFVAGSGASTVTGQVIQPLSGSADLSTQDYVQRVVRTLGCRAVNKGIGGAFAGNNLSGSPTEMLNQFYGQPRAATGAAALTSRAQVVSLNWGVNERAANVQPALAAGLASAISLARQSTRFLGSGTTTSGTGTAAGTYSAGTFYANSGARKGLQVGDTQTINVPSIFPGGEVVAYYLAGTTNLATATFTVDGSAAGSLVIDATTQIVAGSYAIVPMRFTGLAAGAHTIVATGTSSSGGADPGMILDSWTMTAPRPPLVIVHNVTPTGVAPGTASTVPNATVSSVVAGFPANEVKMLDASAAITDFANMISADFIHPTDYGHAAIARAFLALLKTSTWPSAADYVASY